LREVALFELPLLLPPSAVTTTTCFAAVTASSLFLPTTTNISADYHSASVSVATVSLPRFQMPSPPPFLPRQTPLPKSSKPAGQSAPAE